MKHPYVGLPKFQFWKRDPGIAAPADFDPVVDVPFQISPEDKIVTAGSCFAQHVARYLTRSGFNHYVAEPAHPMVPETVASDHNYGLFSARYGNIYTARQLKQLLLRAYGDFTPVAQHWAGTQGRVVDPFRPQIQPEGYLGPNELAVDRAQHLKAVRTAVEDMDFFVFTLGLTECWEDSRDGAVFPLAPGVAGGVYDPETVAYKNFDQDETAQDLIFALEYIRAKNPKVKIILTVSPVPLNATYEPRHVFTSTTWSKAVLRIAAEQASQAFEDCCYFPSYEVITSPHVRGRYFAKDCREVLEAGVDHVMGLFFKHFAAGAVGVKKDVSKPAPQDAHVADMEERMRVHCDEEAIGRE